EVFAGSEDDLTDNLGPFIMSWWVTFKDAPKKPAELIELARAANLVEGKSEKADATVLGQILSRNRDQIVKVVIAGDLKIIRVETSRTWRLRPHLGTAA